jgi:uncharacterized protein YigE (DUF2233 family)
MRTLALALVVGLAGCAGAPPTPPPQALGFTWAPVDSLDARLPASVRVLEGVSETDTLRAWAVHVALDVPLDVVVAEDPADRRETPTEIARRTGACVVLNGGYFNMETGAPVGLVVDAGRLVSPAFDTVEREGVPYVVARGAVGLTADGDVEVAPARDDGAAPCRVDAPPAHRPGAPDVAPACRSWPIQEALGAGPVLVQDGALAVGTDAEVFFGTSIPARHPRSAVGVTADGGVVLVVVDGRQPESRGVTPDELALLLRSLGAEDAVNLDGGGSSALVVQPSGGAPVRLNRPAGGDVEREVSTALAAFCDER